MFGLDKLVGAAVKTVVKLPISVAADAVTMGGLLTDKDQTYTGKTFDQIVDDVEDFLDEE